MADWGVEIAVLGPVSFDGLAQPFRRTAARELVVYLALHPSGSLNRAWVDALWPTRIVPQATVDSTVCDARRALGHAHDGAPRLVRHERRLRLSDQVCTDVERFASVASANDPASCHRALAMVRGVPFTGLSLGDWAVFEGIGAHVESMVAATALQGAADALAARRGAEAEWLVRQALRACPYDERLYRALLRATDAQGNRAGLRLAMAELHLLSGGDESDQRDQEECPGRWLHPRTLALYRELTRSEGGIRGSPTRL